MDPLWILNREIEARRIFYGEKIDALNTTIGELMESIAATRSSHELEVDRISKLHEEDLARLMEYQESRVSETEAGAKTRREALENHVFAERAIMQGEFEEKTMVIERDMHDTEETESNSQSHTMTEAETTLMSLQTEIGSANETYIVLSDRLTGALSKRRGLNTHRQGRPVTASDRQLARVEEEVRAANAAIGMYEHKLEERNKRAIELMRYRNRKLKRDVKAAEQRLDSAKLRMCEINVTHEARMRELGCQIMALTQTPTSKPVNPKKKRGMIARAEELEETTIEVTGHLSVLNAKYRKINEKNQRLKADARVKRFQKVTKKKTQIDQSE